MSEVLMWVAPVAIAAIVGLFVCLRMNLAWSWGYCAQQGITLFASLVCFMYLYPTPWTGLQAADEKKAAVWCGIAWACFIVFNLGQRLLLTRLSENLATFDIEGALRKAKLVPLLAWGPPAQYWNEMVMAMQAFTTGQYERAEQILDKWRADSRLPKQAKDSSVGYSMLGAILQGNWDRIIDLYQEALLRSQDQSLVVYQMASRAYAERKMFTESLACLHFGKVSAARLSTSTFDIAFMTFFALSGAIEQLKGLFSSSTDKRSLPQYVRLYWTGRCYAVRGDLVEARNTFEEALAITPKNLTTWRSRMDAQIASVRRKMLGEENVEVELASPALVARGEQVYREWRLAAELIRPGTTQIAMRVVITSLIVAYVATNPQQFFSIPSHDPQYASYGAQLVQWHNTAYAWGELVADKTWHGEWWRLVSYMFLHGNTAHLLLNVGALYLFGKSIEKIYGAAGFMGLFFGAGILSGIGQAILQPAEAAIGASGAILGIFGACISSMFRLKEVVPTYLRHSELRWMLSVAAAQVIFDQLINNFANATDKSPDGVRIAAFAHIGGMLAGFVLGLICPFAPWKKHSPADITEE